MSVSIFAPLKINLFLHVTGRKPDGYHTLQSHLMVADYGDEIFITPHDKYDLTITGPFAGAISSDDNLITKAVLALCGRSGKKPDIQIKVMKNTPVGAGLGGGSSDVAAVLRALIELWDLKIEDDPLKELLLSLGADVPACFLNQSCWVEGIGEHVTPLPCTAFHGVILFPQKPCNTATIFKNFDALFSKKIEKPDIIDIAFIQNQQNDLTQTAIEVEPSIQNALDVLNAQNEIVISRMSGSGSSCFGICTTRAQADDIAKEIKNAHPTWWVQAVTLS